MADYGLFFGWGVIRAGREVATDRLFEEATAYWDGLRQAGEIESVEVVILAAHGGDLAGFALLRGDRERLARLRMSPEFARLTMWAETCLERVGVVEAYVDAGARRLMDGWRAVVADVA